MTAIIVLNWNGVNDTLSCLESLQKMSGRDYILLVADNASSDDSLSRISRFFQDKVLPCIKAEEKNGGFIVCGENDGPPATPEARIFLLALSENHGFAKGNNLAIAFLEQYFSQRPAATRPDHYLLLNNDTEVEPDFLEKLEKFARLHPEYSALTPQIRYHSAPDRLWNCGGKIFLGLRKYLYGDRPVSGLPQKESLPVSFITGCALFVSRDILEYGSTAPGSDGTRPRLFTESFFFGEEDFNLALRLKKQRKKMACVLTSVIYHKVGATRTADQKTEHVYVYYLNRFTDVRLYWQSPLKYGLWKMLYVPYVRKMFRSIGVPRNLARRYVADICREAAVSDTVDKQKFFRIINRETE